MTAEALIEAWAERLERESQEGINRELDQPIAPVCGRLVQAVGTLYLYEFRLPAGRCLEADTPLSLLLPEVPEPAEGVALSQQGDRVLVQTFDTFGPAIEAATLIPDRSGYLATSAARLKEMLTKTDAYRLGPAARLSALIGSGPGLDDSGGPAASILTTLWSDDPTLRRQRIATMAIDQIRANKRILLVCADHAAADEAAGAIARAMKAGGLVYKTWISRYEMTLLPQAAGMSLHELGFEAQMHQFYAKSRADKAALRRKYERFRELTPILAYKGQKQKDLDEVRLLEWRLLTQLNDLQAKTKEANATLADYETLPLLQRLSMQAVGKNVQSLQQYLALYEDQSSALLKELDVAKARIAELAPEAAVPKDMRPEFEELKEDIVRLGGTKKIRELLAAEEATNRQAFMQNRRLVITTPGRVLGDPLFSKVRFDVLIADNAPWISPPGLLGAAGLVRERVVVAGDTRDITTAGLWAAPSRSANGEKPMPR